MTSRPAATSALLAIAALASVAGCRIGGSGKGFLNENDRLRRENLELRQTLEASERDRAELASKLERFAGERDRALAPEALKALPALARVSIAPLSGLRDADGDGAADQISVFVQPEDGRGRFIQIVGELAVRVSSAPPAGSDAQGEVIARATLGPEALRDAYRSGPIMGLAYRVDLPLEAPGRAILAKADSGALIQIELTDLVTGVRERADLIVTDDRVRMRLSREPARQ